MKGGTPEAPMRPAALLFLLLVLPASAQEFRWGIQAQGTFPTGDLAKALDDATGFGGGLHLFVANPGPHALRARADFMTFKNAHDTTGLDTRVTGTRIGGDYLFFPEENPQSGLYLLVGGDYTRWRTESTGIGVDVTERHGAWGGQLGAGFQFNSRVGIELSGFQSRFRSGSGRAKGISLGLTLRY
jgi:hypothetical protein